MRLFKASIASAALLVCLVGNDYPVKAPVLQFNQAMEAN
tara:strand:+ start:574 stop:690 length:117 start_codon:yes stop_codon:yes gene_type:complete